MADGPRIPDPSSAAESPAAALPTSATKQRRDTWYGLAALSVGLGTWGLIGGWLLGYPLGGETHPDPFEGRWSLGSLFRTIPHPGLAETPLVPPSPAEPRYRKRDNDRAIVWTPRMLAAARIEQPQQQQQQQQQFQQQQQVANAPAPTGKGPADRAAAPIEFAQAYDTNLSDSFRVVTVRAPRPVACLSIGNPAIASLPPTCLVYPMGLPLNRPVVLAPSRISALVGSSRVSYPLDGLVDRERMHVALVDGAVAGVVMPSALTFSRSDDNFALWLGVSDRLLRIVPRSDDFLSATAFESPVSGAPIDLILFVTSTRGWLFTASDDDRERRTGQPAVAVTSDGGVTWQRLWHRWLPAPWVFCAFLIGMFAFERGTRAQAALRPVAAKRHITDHGVSDDPIGLDDADALGLIPISTALSRFLRNFETKPTLAVAVTGPWGAGKSSLMNLVREDLVDRGVCTVWFNAWHYQKEDSLLAALLAAIRAQAVPPVWTPAGINYRMRVGLRRITLDPARAVAFFILALLAALLFWRYGSVVLDVLSQFKGKDEAAGAAPPVPKPEAGGMLASTLAALGLSATGLGGLVLAVKKVWDLFRPLSSLPGDLLASLSGTTKTTDLDQQLSFRHRFQKEFSTFCDVLRWPPYPGLVIFIDDLDRCAPRQTVDVLEAINFVTNAGKCFVILGFDESKVKAAIADIYKDMTLKIDDVAEEKYARADTEGLVRFASQYLQKLVHLTIPVPASSKDTVEKLLGLQTVLPPSPQERRWRRLRRTAVETVAAMIFTTVVASGAWLAMDVIVRVSSTAAVTPEPQKQAAAKAEPRSSVRIPGTAPPPLPEPAPVSPYLTAEDVRRTGLLADNELGFVPPSIVVTAFILILALFGVQFVPRLLSADSAVHDSPEFISALKIWVEAIGKRRATPRDVKRFVNRLRFLAMRLRDLQEEADKAKKPLGLDETRLVSFAAIEDLGEDMLGRSERELAADQAGPRAREIQAIVAKGMREYQGTFEKSLYDDPQMLEAYRRIAGTVVERSSGTADPPPVRLAAEAGRGAPA